MNTFSADDKREFQGKDQRISFLAIFRDLCAYYKDDKNGELDNPNKLTILEIAERAKAVVEWEFKQWPLVEIKDEPFPSRIAQSPIKGAVPNHCPECGADVKHKTGVGKKGSYDFYGCVAYPECKYVFKAK